MSIIVFSPKGGVGKTNISFSICVDVGEYSYISNDGSIVPRVYKNSKIITSRMPQNEKTVYDLGGFITPYIGEILKSEKILKIVIPVINDYNAILKAFELIDFLKDSKHKIIIVANMLDGKNDLLEISEAFNNRFKDLKIIPLKRSKIFKNGLLSGMSAKQMYLESKLNKHIYKSFFAQYERLLKEILS